ncbi:DUF4232 domain-containing protein [Streptomyces sp. NRRL WC-3549]|uniref:DUF4232 domain-containing protein n=1 Tax=Streptomyces sp. NRRL WC-3549 TaxID=1463925 RepID=UPI0004C9B683|nr:DUF4232 domain-containing protein [Streptomyces sp. NRRL WC-3549]
MRTLRLRRTTRTTVLASAALLAGLSLTACQGSGQTAAGTSAPVPAAAAEPAAEAKAPEQGVQASGSETAADSGSSSASASGSPSASGSATAKTGPGTHLTQTAARQGNDDGPVTLACHGGNSKVTFKTVSRPVNHALLTVTNTGSKACNAYGYPAVRFGEAQSVPPAFEESKPQAVVTLAPGESAYAGVMTSSADGSGTGGYSTKSLSVYFQGRDLSGSTGQGANVPLAEKVYVDSTLTVTYWQADMADALMY